METGGSPDLFCSYIQVIVGTCWCKAVLILFWFALVTLVLMNGSVVLVPVVLCSVLFFLCNWLLFLNEWF